MSNLATKIKLSVSVHARVQMFGFVCHSVKLISILGKVRKWLKVATNQASKHTYKIWRLQKMIFRPGPRFSVNFRLSSLLCK